MVDVAQVVRDLDAESAELDTTVSGLDAAGWATETPAQGWTVSHQIAHLAWTDGVALLAATDALAFTKMLEQAGESVLTHVDDTAAEGARKPPEELLDGWRAGRQKLRDALLAVPAEQKLPWFGPPMSAPSMATARIMETWAHGQDVADALGVRRTPTSRLRHVVHIAVRARDFAYFVNGLQPPAEQFRVELTSAGERWTWGPEDAAQRVTGLALDFCLLATQRRHRDDCDVQAVGADADQWLGIAQAFAGPPGGGRKAGQFA